MKYKIRKTGEIVDVIAYSNPMGAYRTSEDCVSYIDSKGSEHPREKGNIHWDFEELVDDTRATEIDWEQRRYEIAKAAMQGRLSNQYGDILVGERDFEGVAVSSVEFADALIKELKKDK